MAPAASWAAVVEATKVACKFAATKSCEPMSVVVAELVEGLAIVVVEFVVVLTVKLILMLLILKVAMGGLHPVLKTSSLVFLWNRRRVMETEVYARVQA